ncbi:methyltransferase domain-containing protein [Actinomycetospora cinnamomea]|uniref:Methyltransferase family protein n=1 Tax=Actinomycetospora cinnamomea TaxID=663609 RepID=A0A2U1EVJ1_9PSEU|nr:class I SAM-dependent methyltransferase [Actinomycetospora cinnamomea]PVZ03929.1 methyltransferase family protein [Actinomycetospora cinnamomea]
MTRSGGVPRSSPPGHAAPGAPAAPDWLALREPADAEARAIDLVEDLRAGHPAPGRILDLGAGTGSMARWLAPRMPGPQHWVLADRDTDLLAHALERLPTTARDGTPVTAETRALDVGALTVDDLADPDLQPDLVTASALLDVLTAEEVDAIAAACVGAGCAALLTLSVIGQVRLDPPEARDLPLAAAFDAHQQRVVDGRRLLGPTAPAVAESAFTRRGAHVRSRASPWQLGLDDVDLTVAWLHGWVAAAVAQDPDLARHADAYLARRLEAAEQGRLRVTVGHLDLLALP